MRFLLCTLASILAGFSFGQLPPNMFGDSIHAPFYFGVTSGDPLANQVIIWSKISTTDSTENVVWEISVYPDFSWLNSTGTYTTDATTDFTIKIDVTGLSPNTNYYYRFRDDQGRNSAIGKTRTAPLATDAIAHMRFAVVSCTSIYSGFFNGYKRISERNDLDFIMHLGDYIYDFVDSDEEVRVPIPYPSVPSNLQEWRERHAYYLLDPDLREARKAHPWITIWDNHDLSNINDPDFAASQQAFYEYLPIRVPQPSDSSKIWRKFSYGALMDVFMVDMYTKKDIDLITPSAYHILGQEQDFWLKDELSNSPARWKIVGNQKMIAGWSVLGLPAWFPGDGTYLTTSSWDGWDESRDALLLYLKNNNIHNVVFMSGDSHVTLVADLSDDPYDGGNYSGSTGAGSIACEFLPTSMTRGNFDEMGISSALLPLANGLSNAANPNHVFSEFISHGYGIINVTPDTLVAELWYSDILTSNTTEVFNNGYYTLYGTDYWERTTLSQPTNRKDTLYLLSNNSIEDNALSIFPVPTDGKLNLATKDTQLTNFKFQTIKIYEIASGKLVKEIQLNQPVEEIEIDISKLNSGYYNLKVWSNSPNQMGNYKILKLD